jgi:putative flavoprotein involved in K+ transport
MSTHYPVIIIGAGQAGLAAGYHLQRAGLNFMILEASSEPGGSWPAYYESLKLFSPARYSSMPGLAFPGDPERYPSRDEVSAYLRHYAEYFNLPVTLNTRVQRVSCSEDNMFQLQTNDDRTYTANAIIAATGAFSKPYIPQLPGQAEFKGQILHSASYRNPETLIGKRVIVVGAGNSAIQIAVELAKHTRVTLASRETVTFRRQRIWGRDVHFWMKITGLDTLPVKYYNINKKAGGVLDTGVHQQAVQAGKPDNRPMFTKFTSDGVMWADTTIEPIDAVIFATGFRPNLDFLRDLNELDNNGHPRQKEGVSINTPGLYYVGLSMQRSHASATLRGVGSDAAHVVQHLKRVMGKTVLNKHGSSTANTALTSSLP